MDILDRQQAVGERDQPDLANDFRGRVRSGERWGQGLTKFQFKQPGGWQCHSAREDERRSCRWR